MSEKEKFTEYVRDQMTNHGMVDMHVSWTPEAAKATEEELFAELNRMIAAPDLPDVEVLGKYSPIF